MTKRQRPNPRHTRESGADSRLPQEDEFLSESDGSVESWARLAADCGVTLQVSNSAYNERWLADVEASNPAHYKMITALLMVISANDGGPISYADVSNQGAEIEAYVRETGLRVIPSNGVEFEGNGKGICHAKYSATKSVALVWENIEGTIFVTFDDHAPIAYHRAIRHLRELRLGKNPMRKSGRTSRKIMEKLATTGQRKHRGWNPRDKFFK